LLFSHQLTIKKIPHIPNPALQKHYRVIQAIALEEQPPGPDEVEDLLMPDVEGIQKYANLIDTFVGDARQLGEAALAEIEPAARKRKADGEEGGAKKLRKEDQDYSEFDWKQMLENDTLKKLTIPDLKVYLRHHKLPLAGTKEKLLDRVTSSIFTDS
jgi:ATP-dependent DNA helicase 2 subunit 1